jgi:hypothetical protein
MVTGGGPITAAFGKYLCVRETGTHSVARDVVARIKDIVPDQPGYSDVVLNWNANEVKKTIQPGGRDYVRVQLIILYEPEKSGTQAKFRCQITPTVLEHAPDRLEFTLELIVDGRIHSSTRFEMKGAWASERLFSLAKEHGTGEWPEIPFPALRQVSR